MGAGADGLYPGPGERVHAQVAQGGAYQDQGVIPPALEAGVQRQNGGKPCRKSITGNSGGRCSIPTRSGTRSGSSRSCSTSTGVWRARPVRWRTSPRGCSRRGRSTCGGTMWRPSPTAVSRSTKKGRLFRFFDKLIRSGEDGSAGAVESNNDPSEGSEGRAL